MTPRQLLACRVALLVVLAVTLAACGSFQTRGPQLDIVLRTQTGTGPTTTGPAPFPHARYTFFSWEDPTNCLAGIQLTDASGQVRAGELFGGRSLAANVPTALVQDDLQDSEYRLRVSTSAPRCSWMVEEILNSMSSSDQPPTAELARPAPSGASTVTSTSPSAARITAAGLYRVSWTITVQPGAMCSYNLNLKTAAGDVEHVDQQPEPAPTGQPTNQAVGGRGGGSFGGQMSMFLVAGARTVSADTSCPWTLTIAPLIGANGGGVRGFATLTG